MGDARTIPLIRLFDNLIVSVQTDLSDAVIEALLTDITQTIEQTNVSGLILDLSGADMLDSHATRRLHDLAVTARLMGVETVLCGLRRSVVITLVEMGLSFSGMTTVLSLERALEHLMQRRHAEAIARLGAASAQAVTQGGPPAGGKEGGGGGA